MERNQNRSQTTYSNRELRALRRGLPNLNEINAIASTHQEAQEIQRLAVEISRIMEILTTFSDSTLIEAGKLENLKKELRAKEKQLKQAARNYAKKIVKETRLKKRRQRRAERRSRK